MAQGRTTFWQELGRRNVLRVAAAYAVASFAMIEVVSNVTPGLHLPDWVLSLFIVVLGLGFPAAVAFAWVYEITPDGLKRTEEVGKDASITHRTAHRLNVVTIALLVLLAGLYGAHWFLPGRGTAESGNRVGSQNAGIAIAVLPFVNLSGDPSQEFFSDGMTEEITSALAKVPSLTVMGRTSAFEFKGQNRDLRAIGQALGVRYLLEGSVRKSGGRVRITGQLIRADSGAHVWTENYDRELTDVFATQDDIARAIAGALQAPLGLKERETLVASRNISPENYQQYLRAKAMYRARNEIDRDGVLDAMAVLEPLVAAEPGYAPAWALLALVYQRLPQSNVIFKELLVDRYKELRPIIEAAWAKARVAAQRAIDLDPRNAEAYAALGLAQPIGKLAAREDFLKRALELEPSNPDVLSEVGLTLGEVGQVKKAVAVQQKLREIEPLVPAFNAVTARTLNLDGQKDAALALSKALPMTYRGRSRSLMAIYLAMGRFADAADAILGAPVGVFKPDEAAAAVRLLRKASAKIPPQELPALTEPLNIIYLYVGAAERMPIYTDNPIIAQIWTLPAYAPVRKTEAFKKAVRDFGLVDYWRARGWPDLCRPVGADDFECN